ncbi:MAG: deoxyribose-phosphate aldolase [Oscillospiraceae bacterium]|jgi:deoxyribose-phosphate aldolase|nr:deoxyribose-phosphate aldolase [Oscillospiraceae bacterium]
MLTAQDIAKMLDHSTLQPFLTADDIRKGCDIALQYGVATVCARPGDMPLVVGMLAGSAVKPCTVIGFPHGAHRTPVKVLEARQALDDGCEELDMVLNIGWIKAGQYAQARDEVAAIAALTHERGAILKVIFETCYLDDAQKIAACKLCAEAGADFVKTSTGYGTAGATVADILLMRAHVPSGVRVKASGGIRDLDTVLAMRAAGAARCGVSATQAIMQEAMLRQRAGTLQEAAPGAAAPAPSAGY